MRQYRGFLTAVDKHDGCHPYVTRQGGLQRRNARLPPRKPGVYTLKGWMVLLQISPERRFIGCRRALDILSL